MIRGGFFGILLGLLLFASGTIGEHSGGALLAGIFFVVMGLWVIAGGVVDGIKERRHAAFHDTAFAAGDRMDALCRGFPEDCPYLWRSGR
jgi:hypothetical protein